MSKGRYVKKKKSSIPLLLILVILGVLAVAAIVFLSKHPARTPSETEPGVIDQIENTEQTGALEQTDTPETDEQNSEEVTAPEETNNATEPSVTQQPTETQPKQTIATQPTVVIVQQADAEYEKWLAAAMVVCVSMEYPDFEIEAIYAVSSTELENKFASEGVYIVFNTEGKNLCIHAKALEAERTAAGTMDISTEAIGFATFDRVDAAAVNFTSMKKIAIEDLGELIAQSLLVSVYAR